MSQTTDETVEQWYQRSVLSYQAVQAEERSHWSRLGFDRKVAPGAAYPLIDAPFHEVMERAKRAEAELKEAAAAVARYRASC